MMRSRILSIMAVVAVFGLGVANHGISGEPPPPPADFSVSRVVGPGTNPDFSWPSVERFTTWIFQLVCTPVPPWHFCPEETWVRSSSHEVWVIAPNTEMLIAFTSTFEVKESRYEPCFGGGMHKHGGEGPGPGKCTPWDIKGLEEPFNPPNTKPIEHEIIHEGYERAKRTKCIPCEDPKVTFDDYWRSIPRIKVKAWSSPDSMPTLGEPVLLSMLSGEVPVAEDWGTFIGFGTGRPLNYLDKLRLSTDKTQLWMFIADRKGVVRFDRTAPGNYELAPEQLFLGEDTSVELRAVGGGAGEDIAQVKYPNDDIKEFNLEVTQGDGIKVYRVIKRITREGFQTTLAYNAGNVTITDASGHDYTCAFDGQKRITGITVGGRTWAYTYAGDKVTETMPDGSSMAITVNNKGQITAIEQIGGPGGGELKEYREYNIDGFLTKVTFGGVEVTVTETEDNGILKRTYTGGDVTRSVWYSKLGAVARADGPGVQFQMQATRDKRFRLTSKTDPEGNTWSYVNDKNGYLQKETAPDGGVWKYESDADYNLTKKTNAVGAVWQYEYFQTLDRRDNQIKKEIHPDNGVVEYVRDVNTGLATRVIDALGNFTDLTYNAAGQVLTEIGPYEPAGPVPPARIMEYDGWGNLVKKTDENGNSWKYEFDNMNRMTKRTCPKGFAEVFKYDGLGRKVEYTDREGAFTKWTIDNRGLVVKIEGGMGGAASGCGSCGGGSARGDYEFDDARQLTKFTDLNTHAMRHEYSTAGRRLKTIDARNYETEFAYSARGDLLTVTDPNGNASTMEYDSVGRLIESADALGNTTVFKYDLEGRQVKVTDAAGGVRKTSYDSMGRVVRVTDPLDNKTRFFYDKNSNQIKVKNAIGVITGNTFDAENRLIKTVSDVGGIAAVTKSKFDPAGRLVRTIDPVNNVMKYKYDADDLLVKIITPLGKETTFAYDKMDRRISTTDGAGRTVTTVYTSEGWVKKTFDGVTTTRFDYDPVGNRIKVKVSGRAAIHSTFDPTNNLIATQQGNITTSREIDGAGRVLTTTDGEGKTSVFEYDAANRLVKTTNPLSESTEHKYDPVGRRTKTTFANGSERRFKYDLAGQLTESDGGPSGKATFTYDDLGRQIATTDANSRIRTTVFDNLNRVTEVKNEMNQPVAYVFDSAGRKLSQTDAENNKTSYAYNNDSELISMSYPGGDEEQYFYDDGGLLKRKKTPNGDNIRYSYNAAGALASTKFGGKTVSYARDAAGAVTEIAGPTTTMKHTYNNLGFMTDVTDVALNQSVAYSYDNRGLRTKMIAAGMNVKYKYDAAMRLVRVKKDSDPAAVYKYDSGGRRVSLKLPNGVKTSYTYTNADQLKKLVTKKADGTVIAGFNYQLDAVGNRTGIDMPSGEKLRYEFDNAYRLTKEMRTGVLGATAYEESFAYDAVGNRVKQVKNGVTTDSTYNDNNQLSQSVTGGVTTKYFYDNNGNNIRKVTPGEGVTRMAYDELNRMTEWRKAGPGGPKTEKTVYRGAEWHRAGLISNGVATAFLYDGANVVADLTVAGMNLAVSRTYVTPFLDQNISMTETAGGASYYFSQDGLGSVRTVTDSGGVVQNNYCYTAFGEDYSVVTNETVQNRYQYTGREQSSVGAPMYFRNRHVWTDLGRFQQRAPSHEDVSNAYEGHFFPNRRDPMGLPDKVTIEDVKKAIADARSKGLNFAADQLQYWLDGKGGKGGKATEAGVREVGNAMFKNLPIVKKKINDYIQKEKYKRFVEAKIRKVGKSMKCGETRSMRTSTHDIPVLGSESSHGLDLKNPLDNVRYWNLRIGVGAYDIAVRDFFTVCKKCDPPAKPYADYEINLTKFWFRIEDQYNWNRNQSFTFPGLGRIHDNDMKKLEKKGGPQPFIFRTKPWEQTPTKPIKWTYRWQR